MKKKKIQVGDRVQTPIRRPTSYGEVIYISPGRKYAVVLKQYGRKFYKHQYRLDDLKFAWRSVCDLHE